jgi:Domain of unknown function (DUF4136)
MWHKWIVRVGPAIVLAFLACLAMCAQDVKHNYRQGTDFAKYRTYKWVDEMGGTPTIGGHLDQILDSEIKQSIDSQLAAKGFTKVESGKADLVVSYQIALTQERQWNASGWGSGLGPALGGLGPWGMESLSGTATSSTINIGTLLLGIYDPAAKQLIWIGAATKTVDPGKNQEKNRKNLDKATQKLLKDFPPSGSRQFTRQTPEHKVEK